MSTPELASLRRANPRNRHDFEQTVATAADRIASLVDQSSPRVAPRHRWHIPRPLIGALAGATAAAIALIVLTRPEQVSASAAMKRAATATAASAEKSGTAVLRITHGGKQWAATTVRWHGDDVAVSQALRARELLVVDGMMYGVEDGSWVVLGPASSVDPDSGTTPDEYLGAVRDDVGGVTLRRLTNGMTGLSRSERTDGSSVYNGKVAAGLLARETGFKDGQHIRVFPFGYVAHDEAANPRALLDTAVVVNTSGVVSEITVTWGTWRYTIAYSKLAETAALAAPANARPLRRNVG